MLHIINYLFKFLFTVSVLASGDNRQSRLTPGTPGASACRHSPGFALATVAESRRRHHLSPQSRRKQIPLETHLASSCLSLATDRCIWHKGPPRTRLAQKYAKRSCTVFGRRELHPANIRQVVTKMRHCMRMPLNAVPL